MDMGRFTREEINSQPEAWAAALEALGHQRRDLERLFTSGKYEQCIFTGCGSTYYLALAAAALTQELTNLFARALPASELWLFPKSAYHSRRTLLVALSRSGETTETLYACERFLEGKLGDLLTLSCYPSTPLAKMGTYSLILPSGAERSVAQTRAFSTLYLGTVALACLWAGHENLFTALTRLPIVGKHILKEYTALSAKIGSDASIDRFYFLGSGPRYGLACELSLKMKEMSLSHSEPFHFLEFRHGPISMVTPSTCVIGLVSSVNGQHEGVVLDDVSTLGGRVLSIGENGTEVRFETGLDEAIRNVLYLPVGQMIAFERSMFKNLDPDMPKNLVAVVRI